MRYVPLALACLLGGLAAPARAGDVETEVLKPVRFVETLELKGVLWPREPEAVAYEGEVYGGTLEVVRALGDGEVQKGTVLVRFDDEEAREQAAAAERDFLLAKLKHAIAEHDLAGKREQHVLKLEQLETKVARTEETMRRFLEIDKPRRIAQSAHSLEGVENRLQDQTEELEQLEKMYKEDDLTEETEEIVLRRTRRNLVRSRKSLEWQRRRHETLLEVTIPRDEADRRMDVRQRRLELASYRKTAPLKLDVSRIDFLKSKTNLGEKKERFEELRSDLDKLRVRAPVRGFAVRGAFRDGKWHDLGAMRKALRPEGKVKAGQTLYTIVHPGNVELVAVAAEADVGKLAVGREARVEPAVLTGRKLSAVLAEVAAVGVGGKHRVLLHLKETDSLLFPGQSAKALVAWRTIEDALTVPTSALIEKDGASYVDVRVEGKTDRSKVETGARQGGRVVIRAGLEAGDVVVVNPEK